jgi:hypothetical protein
VRILVAGAALVAVAGVTYLSLGGSRAQPAPAPLPTAVATAAPVAPVAPTATTVATATPPTTSSVGVPAVPDHDAPASSPDSTARAASDVSASSRKWSPAARPPIPSVTSSPVAAAATPKSAAAPTPTSVPASPQGRVFRTEL